MIQTFAFKGRGHSFPIFCALCLSGTGFGPRASTGVLVGRWVAEVRSGSASSSRFQGTWRSSQGPVQALTRGRGDWSLRQPPPPPQLLKHPTPVPVPVQLDPTLVSRVCQSAGCGSRPHGWNLGY